MFATVPTLSSHVKAGRLTALAITSEQPSAAVPGVPTMNAVYPGFRAESWVGLLAPAKVPQSIIARLNAEVVRILAQPAVNARFAELGYETAGSTPGQFDQWIRAEHERWGRVIRAQKIRID